MSASILVRLAALDDAWEIQAVEVAAGARFREIEDPRIARRADASPYWTAGLERASVPSITLTTFRDVPWNAPYSEKLGFHVVSTRTPALQALVDEQATWGLEPSLRVVMRRPLDPAH